MVVESISDIQSINIDDVVTFSLKKLDIEPNKLFLIIRNLSLPIANTKIDFIDVDVDYWTTCYMKSDIKVEISDFIYQIIERLKAYIDCANKVDYLKYPKFICQNSADLDKLCNFCFSSIYYSVQLQTKTPQNFSTIITEPLPVNSIFLLNYIKQFELSLCRLKQDIKFYQSEFNDENNVFFADLLKNSSYGIMLYGSTTKEWKTFLGLMSMLRKFKN